MPAFFQAIFLQLPQTSCVHNRDNFFQGVALVAEIIIAYDNPGEKVWDAHQKI